MSEDRRRREGGEQGQRISRRPRRAVERNVAASMRDAFDPGYVVGEPTSPSRRDAVAPSLPPLDDARPHTSAPAGGGVGGGSPRRDRAAAPSLPPMASAFEPFDLAARAPVRDDRRRRKNAPPAPGDEPRLEPFVAPPISAPLDLPAQNDVDDEPEPPLPSALPEASFEAPPSAPEAPAEPPSVEPTSPEDPHVAEPGDRMQAEAPAGSEQEAAAPPGSSAPSSGDRASPGEEPGGPPAHDTGEPALEPTAASPSAADPEVEPPPATRPAPQADARTAHERLGHAFVAAMANPRRVPAKAKPAVPDEPRPRRRSGSRRLGVAAALAAIVAAAALTLLPIWLLRHAEASAEDCLAGLDTGPPGGAGACLPGARTLALPRALPWLRSDAEALHARLQFRAAALDYQYATAVEPHADARSRAAASLRALAFDPGVTASAVEPLTLLRGAFEDVAQAAATNDDKRLRAHGFEAALAIARIEPLDALAARADPSEPHRLNLRRGAFLCLRGDGLQGAAALAAADASHRADSRHGDGYDAARLSLVACRQASPDALGFDPRNVRPPAAPALLAIEAHLGDDDGSVDRIGGYLRDGLGRPTSQERRRLLVFVLAATRPELAETLAWLAPRQGPRMDLGQLGLDSPWLLLDSRRGSYLLVDTARAEIAARHLEHLLAAAPDRLGCEHPGCAAADALERPGPVLRRAAAALWLEAAVEWARRGRSEPAGAAVRRVAELLDGGPRPVLAAIYLATREPGSALDVLPSRPTDDAATELGRALALAALQRYDVAYEAARRAYLAPGERTGESRVAAGWMWGAMALRTDNVRRVLDAIEAEPTPDLETLIAWLRLISLPEPERRKARRDAGLDAFPGEVLPAVMYVAGRAVPADHDVEVWLDHVFHDEHRRGPLRAMWARAEAARWRGDASAAELWSARAEKLQALLPGEAGAVLGHALGIR